MLACWNHPAIVFSLLTWIPWCSVLIACFHAFRGVHGFCFADGTFSSSCSCSHLSFDSTNSTFTTEESQRHIINLHWRRLQGRGLPVQVGDTGTVFLRCWGVRDEMSGNIWHGRSAAYIIAASIRIQYLDQFPGIFSEVTTGSFCLYTPTVCFLHLFY